MPDVEQSILLASEFCKKWEGLASLSSNKLKYVSDPSSLSEDVLLYAYSDTGGVPTIGWGTTKYHYGDKAGQDVSLGDVINKSQADLELDYEIRDKESIIRSYFTNFDALSTEQYAALLSFAYNAGQGSLQRSNILTLINSGAPVTDIVAAWKVQNIRDRAGNYPNGLKNRRIDESMLFDGSYNALYSYYLRNRSTINIGLVVTALVLLSVSLYLKFVVFNKKNK